MHTTTHTIFNTNATGLALETKVFRILLATFLVLMGAYIFLVGHITFSVIARKSLDSEVRALKSHVGELELEYLNANTAITLDLAHTLGYQESQKVQFVTPESTTSVSLR